MQMFYPDHYNDAFVRCPDRSLSCLMTADLYQRPTSFYLQGAQKQVEQPAMRELPGADADLHAGQRRL